MLTTNRRSKEQPSEKAILKPGFFTSDGSCNTASTEQKKAYLLSLIKEAYEVGAKGASAVPMLPEPNESYLIERKKHEQFTEKQAVIYVFFLCRGYYAKKRILDSKPLSETIQQRFFSPAFEESLSNNKVMEFLRDEASKMIISSPGLSPTSSSSKLTIDDSYESSLPELALKYRRKCIRGIQHLKSSIKIQDLDALYNRYPDPTHNIYVLFNHCYESGMKLSRNHRRLKKTQTIEEVVERKKTQLKKSSTPDWALDLCVQIYIDAYVYQYKSVKKPTDIIAKATTELDFESISESNSETEQEPSAKKRKIKDNNDSAASSPSAFIAEGISDNKELATVKTPSTTFLGFFNLSSNEYDPLPPIVLKEEGIEERQSFGFKF